MNSEFPETPHQPELDPFRTPEKELKSPVVSPYKSWRVYLSWLVIIGITVGIFCMTVFAPMFEEKEKTAGQAEMMQVNMTAKMLVGQSELMPVGASSSTQLQQMNTGSLEQRYGIVLLENEMIDTATAQKTLESIDEFVEEQEYIPTDDQKRLRKVVGELLDQYENEQWDSSTIETEDRDLLIGQLGWVGKLGLTPDGSPNVVGRQDLVSEAKRTAIILLSMCGAMGLGLFIGLGSLVTFGVLAANGRLRSSYLNQTQRSHIYIETFAIWMTLFVASQFVIGFISEYVELRGVWTGTLITLGIFFGSLVVLIWPVLRGISFSTVREDIGWTTRNPIKEIGAGIVGYVAMMPMLAIAFVVVIVMMGIGTSMNAEDGLSPVGGGGHPIQEQIATGNVAVWIGVFLTACVAAPIVEETMFRGVFFRYLRDSSSQRWARMASLLFACVVNGLIFASIHPQGLIGIPLLTTLAVGMSLAREWRDSLIAPMTMHAINNGLVTCLMFSIF